MGNRWPAPGATSAPTKLPDEGFLLRAGRCCFRLAFHQEIRLPGGRIQSMVRLIGDASAWLSRCRADDAGPGGARKAPRRLRLPLRLLVGGAPSQVTFRQSHGPARHSRGEIIRCLRPAVRLYSGPTTMAPTMSICELVRMPTAPISPAIISRMKKLGA